MKPIFETYKWEAAAVLVATVLTCVFGFLAIDILRTRLETRATEASAAATTTSIAVVRATEDAAAIRATETTYFTEHPGPSSTPTAYVYAATPTPVPPTVAPTVTGESPYIQFGDDLYPIPVPGLPTDVPPPPPGESGFLWWYNDYSPLAPGEIRPNTPAIAIIGPQHQEGPSTAQGPNNVLDVWIARGEACKSPTPVGYILRPDVQRPSWAIGVQVVGGPCNGFVGWVFPGATHPLPPGVQPTQDPFRLDG